MRAEDRTEIRSRRLRRRAEELLRQRPEGIEGIPGNDIKELIHELGVHQIELEMQNEELRDARSEIEELLNKYFDLYELAPVGYFTFDQKGLILEANLTGANLLGIQMRHLIKRGFTSFVSSNFQDEFYFHCKRGIETRAKQSCELELVKTDGTTFYAHLESMVAQDGEGNYNHLRTALTDITEHRQAEDALRKAHDELESRVEKRTAELIEANEQLRLKVEERKLAEEALRNSEERERRRLATNLHDSVAQTLAISKMKLEVMRNMTPSAALAEKLGEVHDSISLALDQSRFLTFELSPPELYELGLEAALEHLSKRMQKLHAIRIQFVESGQPRELSEDLYVLLYRAVQELLVNIVKHAQARNARITLGWHDNRIRIKVEDDGIGFDTTGSDIHGIVGTDGFGLFSVSERLRHVGGCFEIDSQSGQGTRVTLVAPSQSKGGATRRQLPCA